MFEVGEEVLVWVSQDTRRDSVYDKEDYTYVSVEGDPDDDNTGQIVIRGSHSKIKQGWIIIKKTDSFSSSNFPYWELIEQL